MTNNAARKKMGKRSFNWIQRITQLSFKDCGLVLLPSFPVLGAWPNAIGDDFIVEIKRLSCSKTSDQFWNVRLSHHYIIRPKLVDGTQLIFQRAKQLSNRYIPKQRHVHKRLPAWSENQDKSTANLSGIRRYLQ